MLRRICDCIEFKERAALANDLRKVFVVSLTQIYVADFPKETLWVVRNILFIDCNIFHDLCNIILLN